MRFNILFLRNYLFIIFIVAFRSVLADHASINFETGVAGAIMTTPGATLKQGEVVIGASAHFVEFDDISNTTLEQFGAADVHIHSTDYLLSIKASLAYGLTDDLTLGISIPYVERNNIRAAHDDMGVGEVEFAGDASGIGDMNLFAQYRFLHNTSQDLSFLGGIKTPSGKTDERELGGVYFGTEHQPGTGSWDPFLGLAYNRVLGRLGFSGNVLYTFTTEGERQTELGDIFNYNLAVSYRLSTPEGEHDHHHHKHALDILDYVDLVLELNGDVRREDQITGVDDEHTGGHLLYLSPGMRVGLGHNWSIYTSVGVPIVNNLNGTQSEPEYRIIGGISKVF